MLEDDSGRIRLVGERLKRFILVTGCIMAVMGTENAAGEFEVIDLKFPDLAPQPDRWSLSPSRAAGSSSSSSNKKIAIVSGLEFSGTDSSYAMELNLLLEYLLGEACEPSGQKEVAKISRLIVAGNSIAPERKEDAAAVHLTGSTTTEKRKLPSHGKKYGYDASSYNPLPAQLLDGFLNELLPSMPVTLLPGASDPANASYPQQPIHTAILPQSRAYVSVPGAKEPGWLDAATNPWEAEVEGWRLLGTGGQNLDDIFKYVDSHDRLGMMEATCRWRISAPTAPDTLCESATPDPPAARE